MNKANPVYIRISSTCSCTCLQAAESCIARPKTKRMGDLICPCMALLRYFKPSSSLPTANETDISDAATREANAAVSCVLASDESRRVQPGPSGPLKRKAYTSFSEEQRAAICQYAAEHGNTSAVKRFKADFEGGLGESTVWLFKKKYLLELKKAKEYTPAGQMPEVSNISTKPGGRPLLIGELDSEVQAYVKALRKAGTPVRVPVVIAAAEGIVTARNRTLLLKFGGHIELARPWAVSLLR